MSNDLIQRLRASAAEWLPTSDHTLRAHNLLEEAAGTLDRLDEEAARTARNRDMWKGQCERQAAELEALRRGELICQKCGLRKDADAAGPVPF